MVPIARSYGAYSPPSPKSPKSGRALRILSVVDLSELNVDRLRRVRVVPVIRNPDVPSLTREPLPILTLMRSSDAPSWHAHGFLVYESSTIEGFRPPSIRSTCLQVKARTNSRAYRLVFVAGKRTRRVLAPHCRASDIRRDVRGEAFVSIRSVSRTFSAALSIILLLRFRQLPLPRTETMRAGTLGGAFLVK